MFIHSLLCRWISFIPGGRTIVHASLLFINQLNQLNMPLSHLGLSVHPFKTFKFSDLLSRFPRRQKRKCFWWWLQQLWLLYLTLSIILGLSKVSVLENGSVSITRCKGRKHPNLAKPVRKRTIIFFTLLMERNSVSKTLCFKILKSAKKVNSDVPKKK